MAASSTKIIAARNASFTEKSGSSLAIACTSSGLSSATAAAITWYRKAEALNPGDGRLLFNLALAYDQDQAYAPAVDYYLKYLKAAKEDLDAAGRGQIQARVRALQAELTAAENGDRKP